MSKGAENTRIKTKFATITFRPVRPGEDAPAALDAWDLKGPAPDAPYWTTVRWKECVLQQFKADWKPGVSSRRFLFPGRGFVMEGAFTDSEGYFVVNSIVQHLRFSPGDPFGDVTPEIQSFTPARSSLFARPISEAHTSGVTLYEAAGQTSGFLWRYEGCSISVFGPPRAKASPDVRVARMVRTREENQDWGLAGNLVSVKPTGAAKKVRVLGRPFERRDYIVTSRSKGRTSAVTVYVHFRPDGAGFAYPIEFKDSATKYTEMLKP